MYPQVKKRRKAKSDLWRKFNVDQSSNYSPSRSGEKHTRRKRLYHYESEEPNPPTNRMPEPSAHQQNIKFYPERRENQPFFLMPVYQQIQWMLSPKPFAGFSPPKSYRKATSIFLKWQEFQNLGICAVHPKSSWDRLKGPLIQSTMVDSNCMWILLN